MTHPTHRIRGGGVGERPEAYERLAGRYDSAPPDQADIVVALGGDGHMLETLHAYRDRDVPIYGMNRGTVGFLMNEYREAGLLERVADAGSVRIRPLEIATEAVGGDSVSTLAINEVSLLRQTRQAAKIRILIDGKVRLPRTDLRRRSGGHAAGSTAYNLSAHGPIIPLDAKLLALTPISAFRPRRWRGALLPDKATITLEVLEPRKRPVSAVGDDTEVRDVQRVLVRTSPDKSFRLLFDSEHNLEDRILNEQFIP